MLLKERIIEAVPESIRTLLITIMAILIFSIFCSFIANLKGEPICIKKSCIDYFMQEQKYTIVLIINTLSFVAFIVTAIGVYTAIHTYISTVSANISNANNNHFQNFKMFVESEIKNKNSIRDINIFVLYNEIFGREKREIELVSTSETYKLWILNLIKIIENANKNYTDKHTNKNNYTYKKHQTIVIEHFEKIKIPLPRSTRTGFYQLETEVFSFISTLNHDFCLLIDDKYKIVDREYPKNTQ